MIEMASNGYIQMRRQEQGERQRLFPADRIALGDWPSAISEDMIAMREYRTGEITFDTLRMKIAANNCLDNYFEDHMVPADAMRNLLRFTGWERPDVNAGIQ